MSTPQSDETAQEILVTYQTGDSYLADRVKQALGPTDYPVLTRHERWDYNADQYLIVIRLCDQSGKTDNVLRYDTEKIRSKVLDKPEVRHRNLTDREREKHVGEAVSKQVIESLGSLI